MQSVFQFIIRLILLMAGLVFAASLLVALLVVFFFWTLRRIWAKLTGQPTTPFVMRMDPRAGFGQVYSAAFRGRRGVGPAPSDTPPKDRRAALAADLADVTDVEAKPPKS